VGPQVIFIYSHSWRKIMMLHTCESTSGLRLLATNVDFFFTKQKKKNDIAHLWACKWLLFNDIGGEL